MFDNCFYFFLEYYVLHWMDNLLEWERTHGQICNSLQYSIKRSNLIDGVCNVGCVWNRPPSMPIAMGSDSTNLWKLQTAGGRALTN